MFVDSLTKAEESPSGRVRRWKSNFDIIRVHMSEATIAQENVLRLTEGRLLFKAANYRYTAATL